MQPPQSADWRDSESHGHATRQLSAWGVRHNLPRACAHTYDLSALQKSTPASPAPLNMNNGHLRHHLRHAQAHVAAARPASSPPTVRSPQHATAAIAAAKAAAVATAPSVARLPANNEVLVGCAAPGDRLVVPAGEGGTQRTISEPAAVRHAAEAVRHAQGNTQRGRAGTGRRSRCNALRQTRQTDPP
jgi:hypothetical protein